MAELYADVIINNPNRSVDKIFQYLIPIGLRLDIKKGSLVLVPFGKRHLYGYVINITDKKKYDVLKKIECVCGDELSLNEEQLYLAEWISEFYLTPKIKALKLFFPESFFPRVVKYIKPEKNNFKKGILSKEAQKTYEILLNSVEDWTTQERLFKNLPDVVEVYKELLSKGFILEKHVLHNIKRRNEWHNLCAKLNISNQNAVELLVELEKKAKKQHRILNKILQGRKCSIKCLIKETNTDIPTIKKLIEKEIIKTERYPSQNGVSGENRHYGIKLNVWQHKAFDIIATDVEKKIYNPYLLYGVTGSGKTEIYIKLIEKCIKDKRQVILVVPEIFLTMQILKRLENKFAEEIVVFHSKLTPKEKYKAWQSVKLHEKNLIIGARSAIFAPTDNLGLIIIDEEHDSSYKQEVDPKYNAKEIAIKRALSHNCPVVLGSATPSVEIFSAAQAGKIKLLNLPNRGQNQELPHIDIIDMRDELRRGNSGIFSEKLQNEIKNVIKQKKQAILYLNRRGFASFIMCKRCGYVVKCENCDVSLTYHQTINRLLCHHCDYKIEIPKKCPQCDCIEWSHLGLGTQRVEDEVKILFPGVKTLRIDGDISGDKETMADYLDKFINEEAQILIGTQMIAKGLDFPKVTLVGIIYADMALNIPDFRNRERSFQLLTQVAGRAGRGEWLGKVLIQTFNPKDMNIIYAQKQDYDSFYQEEIMFRKAHGYPPFSKMAKMLFTGANEEKVEESAKIFLTYLLKNSIYKKNIQIMGPSPCGLAKIKKEFRWQLLLKFPKDLNVRPSIRKAIEQFYTNESELGKIKLSVDLNPNSFV